MNQDSACYNLKSAILLLEQKQQNQLYLLKEQGNITYKSLMPINLIKNTLQQLAKTPELDNHLGENIIGFTTGYVAKKMLVGKTKKPFKMLFGMVLQFVVTNIVTRNSERIKAVVESLLHSIVTLNQEQQPYTYESEN